MASVTITRCFNPFTVLVGVSNCLGADYRYFLESLKTGECQGWEINGGDSFAITRTEKEPSGKLVLVVCCYEGKELSEFAVFITHWAANNDFSKVRFHTAHRALHNVILPVKARFVESIYEVDL